MDSPVFDSPVLDSPVFDSPVFDSPVFDSPVFDSNVFDSPDSLLGSFIDEFSSPACDGSDSSGVAEFSPGSSLLDFEFGSDSPSSDLISESEGSVDSEASSDFGGEFSDSPSGLDPASSGVFSESDGSELGSVFSGVVAPGSFSAPGSAVLPGRESVEFSPESPGFSCRLRFISSIKRCKAASSSARRRFG